MRSGVIAQKIGMTRVFADDGRQTPVTVLRLEGLQVVAQRTEERDGYSAVQLGAGFAKPKNVTQPMLRVSMRWNATGLSTCRRHRCARHCARQACPCLA